MSANMQMGMAACGLGAMLLCGCAVSAAPLSPQEEFCEIRDNYVAQVAPLEKEANSAWWESATTGSDSSYARREKADNALAKLHQDHAAFAKLKELRASKVIADPALARELELMYSAYVPYQADPQLTSQIIAREAEVDKIFNTHRSQVNGESLTENEVRKTLTDTKDSQTAFQAWQGYMNVGRKVAGPLKDLIKLRNQVAVQLGYRDYFVMSIELQEFKEDELLSIFDNLDKLTAQPFAELKGQIDNHMRQRFALKEGEAVRPWHLGDLFFQEAPELNSDPNFSLDKIYEGRDPAKISTAYYHSMGLDPESILARSDLYERPGKSPHAFETCIDRQNDIRVLCNVKPNGSWMDTMNHELGHGLYDQGIGKNVPFLLHTPAHILTTEGFAMFMGEMTRTGDFLKQAVGVPDSELPKYSQASWQLLRSERLIFSRWTQTMLHFEREMYKNPDQDLNKLWWSLKKKYQLQEPPLDMSGADYGAKMHIVGAPVYYHNYMLGDLFASQLYTYLAKHVVKTDNPLSTSLYGQPAVGKYLETHVFAPGNTCDWRELVKRSTGEPLSPEAFAKLYLK